MVAVDFVLITMPDVFESNTSSAAAALPTQPAAVPTKTGDSDFGGKNDTKGLRGRAIRGGTVVMAAQAAKFVLQMGSTVVLARLLTLKDYGLVGMVTIVTGFVAIFKDLGLSDATVQRAEINRDQVNALFWINVVLSLFLTVLAACLAPVVVWFYGEPRLFWIMIALAGTFVISGLTAQHQALMRREMRFTTLSFIDIVSMTAGIVAAIVFAEFGMNYWALVANSIVSALAFASMVWAFSDWRPGLPARGRGASSMIFFGSNLTGFNLVNYCSRNLDNVLVGRFWGTAQLALYDNAYKLLKLPLQQINAPIGSIAVPVLSRLQNDPEQYRRYYCRAINLIAYFTLPLIAGLAALSDEVIAVVLGPQWGGASRIFRILAFASAAQPIPNTIGWIFVSLGRSDRLFRWGLFSAPIVVVSFFIGVPWGAMGVATAYAIATAALTLPCIWYGRLGSPVSMRSIGAAVWRPYVIAAIVYFVAYAIHHSMSSRLPPGSVIALALLSVGAALLSAFYLWPGVAHEVRALAELLKGLKSPGADREQK
jgi:PST family polysaccharide transporter